MIISSLPSLSLLLYSLYFLHSLHSLHPLHEISEQLQTCCTAFLRMKLRSPDVFADNNAAIRRTIIGDRCYALPVLWLNIVGVREIEISIGRDTGKNG